MSNDTSVIKEIHLKKMIPGILPFKVTQGHRKLHGLIRRRWLPINKHEPILCCLRDKRRFQSKIAKFSHRRTGVWLWCCDIQQTV